MRVRRVLVYASLAMSATFVVRCLLQWPGDLPQPALLVGALALFLVATLACLFGLLRAPTGGDAVDGVLPHEARRTPLVVTMLAFAAGVTVPVAVWTAVGPEHATASFATWPIGAVGLLMTIVMVGRRPWFAWLGVAAMGVTASLVLGLVTALGYGLVGSIVWVGAAQLILRALDRASRDTDRLAELQQAALAWQASQSGRQRERRVQVQRALTVAGPVLGRTIATQGRLDNADRAEARLAEARLRDELRGPRLLDDTVRAALADARDRGATVTMLDEGGLDDLDDRSLALVRAELADTIRQADSPRLYIRTSPHAEMLVTVVGRTASESGLSDEDSVELFHQIGDPRHARA